jgi:putative salt-induced outer membrane protein YdiY
VFAGADILRNTFAGIDSRVLLAAGAGHVWVDTEEMRFKSNYGVTYTFQHDVVENPFLKTSFPGTRVTLELKRRVSSSARLESGLVGDLNFSDTGDTRLDFTNALPVSVTSAISLKPSLQLLWRNQPALRQVDLFSEDGAPTGERVVVPFEKLDSFFTLAVVLTL